MTAILRPRHPGVQAIGIEIVERLETVATKVRFRVKYDGDPGNAPTALCAKGYLNPAMHEQVAGTVTEAVFYETIAAGLPVRTPPCVHAAVDPGTSHGLVVMTDLVEAGSTFLDPLGSYSVDQAAATLDQIAALHAATWERGATLTMPQFAPRIDRLVEIMSADALQQLLDDGRAPALGDSVRRADRLQEAVVALTKLDHAARCLVHGDVHTGNIYLAPDGLPGIIDWQVAQRGVWAIDVAYHIAAVLDPAVRAGAEVDLVRHYLDRLALRGGPVMPFDEA
jgi:aminoglycoside phosphotransferase (APT) family kinase protein